MHSHHPSLIRNQARCIGLWLTYCLVLFAHHVIFAFLLLISISTLKNSFFIVAVFGFTLSPPTCLLHASSLLDDGPCLLLRINNQCLGLTWLHTKVLYNLHAVATLAYSSLLLVLVFLFCRQQTKKYIIYK